MLHAVFYMAIFAVLFAVAYWAHGDGLKWALTDGLAITSTAFVVGGFAHLVLGVFALVPAVVCVLLKVTPMRVFARWVH